MSLAPLLRITVPKTNPCRIAIGLALWPNVAQGGGLSRAVAQAPGRGGGQLSPGAGLDPPTPRSPRGGVSPGVDVRLMLWWVRWMQTKGEEGYMLRSFIRGYMECREDDPCKDPAVTNHAITKDYTPWKSVTTREVNENELEWLRPYGEMWIPVPLPGMTRIPR